MIWLIIAWAVYAAGIHDIGITYDDVEWGLSKRLLHGMFRGVVLLFFIFCCLNGFNQIGVLP